MDHKKKKNNSPFPISSERGEKKARKFLSAPWWLLENFMERAERGKFHFRFSVNCANRTLNKNKTVLDGQTVQTCPNTAHFLPESGKSSWGLSQHPLC